MSYDSDGHAKKCPRAQRTVLDRHNNYWLTHCTVHTAGTI